MRDAIENLHPPFAAKVANVVRAYDHWLAVHRPGYRAILGEGHRTTARQRSLWAKGRTLPGRIVTWLDGIKGKSSHQSGLAADVWLIHNGAAVWPADPDMWRYLGHCAREQGLEWGGDWKQRDYPHIQWPRKDRAAYRAAELWLKVRGL